MFNFHVRISVRDKDLSAPLYVQCEHGYVNTVLIYIYIYVYICVCVCLLLISRKFEKY